MALTVDAGPHADRYQGITALNSKTLVGFACDYFRSSEHLPTTIVTACNTPNTSINPLIAIAALMIQRLPSVNIDGNSPEAAWQEAAILANTVTTQELLQPQLMPTDLLFKLFHEYEVRVFDTQALHYSCRCNRKRVIRMLQSFPRDEIMDMSVNDELNITCEYCGTEYSYGTNTIDTLICKN